MSIKQKILSGVQWTAIDQFATQLIQLGVFFVLARLVSKEAFGLVALTTVFAAFFHIFARKGFDDAIIQRTDLSEKSLDTAFWCSLAVGSVLTILCAVLGPIVAVFYDEPRIIPVLGVMAVSMLFGSLSAIPLALLRRRLAFRPVALRSIAARLVGGAVGVSMAFAGFDVWALVAAQLIGEFVSMVLLWFACRYRPGMQFCRRDSLRFLKFGGWVIGSQIMNFFNRRSDALIVGKVFGLEVLGVYSVSMKLIDVCVYTFMGVTGQVGYPVMCRLKEVPKRFEDFTVMLIAVTVFLVTPVAIILALYSDFWIGLLFGEKWNEAVPVIALLAPMLMVKLSSWTESLGITAVGRPDKRMYLAVLFAFISVSSLLVGGFMGFEWLVLFASGRYFLMAVVTAAVFCALTPVSLRRLMEVQTRPLLLGMVVIGGGAGFLHYLNIYTPTLQILTQVLTVAVYFAAVAFSFRNDVAFSEIKGLAWQQISGALRRFGIQASSIVTSQSSN